MTLFNSTYKHRIGRASEERLVFFEMKSGEFSDLLSFASGFNEFAT
jgi:hypothetical protein